MTPTRHWRPAPTTRTWRPRGRTPKTFAPHRRRSWSTVPPWPRPAATSPEPCATPELRSTWPAPRTTSCGAAQAGSSAWPPGPRETSTSAIATFSEAVRSLHAAGNLVDELDATVVLADMWVAAGRPSRARRLYEQALATATGNGEPYPRATADLHVGLAELDRELDDLSSAEAHLETARVLAERGSITENRHRWPMAMAQVRAARGDHEAATRLLEEAAALYRHGFYPDVRPIAAMQARLQISAGDLDVGSDVGSRTRTRRRRRPGLPARVRTPHPGPAAPGPTSRCRALRPDRNDVPAHCRPHAARPAARRGRRHRTRRQPAGDPDAAGPRPPRQAATATRRSVSWARR